MLRKVYTIYDKVAQETGPLMVFNNDEHAIRTYPTAFKNQPEAKFDDFMLCYLGTIDTSNMLIQPEETPVDITPMMGERENK